MSSSIRDIRQLKGRIPHAEEDMDDAPAAGAGPRARSISPGKSVVPGNEPDTSSPERLDNWRKLGQVLKLQRWVRKVFSRRRVRDMIASRRAQLERELYDDCATTIQRKWREHRAPAHVS